MNIRIFSPDTVKEAVELLATGGGRVLAGGTDLIIELRRSEKKPDFLVDISAIKALRQIHKTEEQIILGAGVTFSDIINDSFIRENAVSLWEAAARMGACQVQNRATIGGNICNAAPAADSIPVLMTLNASCILISKKGRREVPIAEFILDKGKTSLEEGELLEKIVFKKPGRGEGCAFVKLGRRSALSIASISCAVKLMVEKGRIMYISIYTGSLGAKSTREEGAEGYFLGRSLRDIDMDSGAAVLSYEVEKRLGGRASMDYKKEAVKGIFKEALQKALEDVKADGGKNML